MRRQPRVNRYLNMSARIIVIGAGPAGYETAVEAVSRGFSVTLVSEGPLGGTCLNEGCIPTKTFCSSTDLQTALARKEEVVGRLRSGVESLMKGVNVVYGHAEFVSRTSVVVGEETLDADYIIVATGSESAALAVPGADKCLTSSEMLSIQNLPSRLCVIGGGVIGLEFASVFASFGSKVTVLEYCPQVLPRFDSDAAKRLKASLVKRGITVVTSAEVKEIGGNVVTYRFKGEDCSAEADCVLMAVGRRPRVDGLALEKAGVRYGKRGIEVDGQFRTSASSVYAVGDVIGGIMLAHVATFQGLTALDDICAREGLPVRRPSTDFGIVPAVVFTEPELAVVGRTEDECREENIPYLALKSFYRANGKAVSMGEDDGYCKVLVEKESGRILGAHILGAHSSDLIHEVAVLMALDADARKAASIIHAHPTLSELLLNAFRQF